MEKFCVAVLLFMAMTTDLLAQNDFRKQKGTFVLLYGYNRSGFLNSNIHFMGDGYDFVLHKVNASDRPTPASEIFTTYLNPTQITIPQFNFRMGYYLKEDIRLSIGWDHMKYVIDHENYKITGHIDPVVSKGRINTGAFAGDYNGEEIVADTSLITFEHTDGYNFAAIEVDKVNLLWASNNKKLGLRYIYGAGIGLVVPRSDVKLFKVGKNHYWNVSGWGVSGKAGMIFDFSKHFFVEADFKTGFTRLSNIPTTGYDDEHATQSIVFYEGMVSLGIRFGKVKD